MQKLAAFLIVYFLVAIAALQIEDLSTTLSSALLCFVVYLISLGLLHPRSKDARRVSLWPPFLIAFFFYNNTYPFIQNSGINIDYPGLETSEKFIALAQAQATLAFAIMCAIATISEWVQVGRSSRLILVDKRHFSRAPIRLIIGANILLTLVSMIYFSSIAREISEGVGRVQIAKQFNLNLWVFIGWLHLLFYFGAIIKASGSANNSNIRNRLVMAMLLLAIYCLMDSALGGRKILAAALLGTIYGSLRFGVPRVRIIMLAVPVSVLAMSVRAVFYDKFSGEADGFASIALQLGGEFVFTFLTFPTTVASQCNFYESSISSYMMTILQFVPRIFWDDKPYSLAQSLSNYLYGGQEGFSIIPMAEAWCTFGIGAGFIFPLVIGLLFVSLQRISFRLPMIGFVVYSHSLELNRGEVSYLVFQVATLYAIFALSGKLAKAFRFTDPRASLYNHANPHPLSYD